VIAAQIPFEISATANVVISMGAATSAPLPVTILSSAPGIFTWTENGLGQAVLVNNADGALNTAANPIARGQIAYFYATGLGQMTPPVPDGSAGSTALHYANIPATVLIGGVPAQVLFAGQAPGFTGVDQINIVIPSNAPTGSAVPLVMQESDGTLTSGQVTIAIQ
jgi:uncharacterized protein (TIGR03437 family)